MLSFKPAYRDRRSRSEIALLVPLEGAAAWGKEGMFEGVAFRSLGCCSPLASVSFSVTTGSPSALPFLLPHSQLWQPPSLEAPCFMGFMGGWAGKEQ